MKKICVLLISIIVLLSVSCRKKEKAEDPNAIYSCSMDPQVVEHHPGKCPICHMDLTKVSGIPDKNDNTIHISDEEKKLANIKTEFVELQTLNNEKTFPAVVSVNQKLTDAISSRISGRIDMLYYRSIGEKVEKGLPLFQIYSEELIAAEKQYLVALQQSDNSSALGIDYTQLAEAALRKLELWGMSSTQLFELKRKGIPESVLTVYADRSGIIADVMVTMGDYVMEGTPVYKLTDLSSVWVEAQVYSSEAASIQENTKAEVTFPSLPDKTVEAKINFANPELLGDSKLILARIEIPNTDHALTPGMQAYITVRTHEKETLAISSSAVLHDSHGATVWLKKSPGVYEPRMVEIGMVNKEYTEILSGLEEGDAVVISGAYLLQSEYIFKKGQDPMAGMKM
ncbi:MAG TPA: efflux RND transporter periplasmic adaptor subunit [Chitinophagales bacterium]|nr:efflux RND transporter periplasmic adaptor subunit [Chitinophagales bacterium]